MACIAVAMFYLKPDMFNEFSGGEKAWPEGRTGIGF
jgi:hypothetical protein